MTGYRRPRRASLEPRQPRRLTPTENEMTDWLIIDSVPTDGTCVDLMNGDEVVLSVYWGEPDTQDDDDPFDQGWLRDGDYIPTHWRPAIRGR